MADLSTSYMGLKLRNPIIAGSSGLTNSLENIQKIYDHGAGAVVLKSLFEEQINFAINKTFNQSENNYSYPEALDYISHYTRENDLEKYLKLIREAKSKVDIPIIASINCVSSSEWISFAKKIQDAGADALELNIFILPSDPRRKADQHEQVYFDILQAVMKQVKIPVAAKISYYFSGLTNMALQLSWTGIAGLVLFNRFFSPDIDIDKFEVTSGNVFSTPGEMSLTLRWVAMLSDKVHCDIAASTGIHDGHAVIKQLLAGAKAVQVASILYQKGFEQIGLMSQEMEVWMEKHQFAHTSDFIGILSYKEAKNPAAYERVQFMKHFAGIE
jgi:dihydroorotate dehydrogenase (fumarate)